MSTPASNIINRVRNQLIDTGAYASERWTDSELLGWLADGERTLIAAAPRVSQVRTAAVAVAGSRQTIPAGGYMYLTAYRNLLSDGVTPGNALQETPRGLLDAQYPGWHSMTPVPSPFGVVFDPSDPTAYELFPPSDGSGKIDLSYSVAAQEYANTSQNIVVQDIYATPLFDYVMWRATQKDSDYVSGQQTAMQYVTAFQGFLKGLLVDPPTLATQGGKT